MLTLWIQATVRALNGFGLVEHAQIQLPDVEDGVMRDLVGWRQSA
jgi:hypothetical protein